MDYSKEELTAIRKYSNHEPLQFSTGICGKLTYGYGELSSNGYWQYPLPYEQLSEKHKKLINDLDNNNY